MASKVKLSKEYKASIAQFVDGILDSQSKLFSKTHELRIRMKKCKDGECKQFVIDEDENGNPIVRVVCIPC